MDDTSQDILNLPKDFPVDIIVNIHKWKTEYGAVNYVKYEGTYYVYRDLTMREFAALMRMQNYPEIYMEDSVCRACVLYPDESVWSAGLPKFLSAKIIASSPFQEPEKLKNAVNSARDMANYTIMDQIVELICSVFPYKPEEVESMPIEVLFRRLAMAERMSGNMVKFPSDILSAKEREDELIRRLQSEDIAIPAPPASALANNMKSEYTIDQLRDVSAKQASRSLAKAVKEGKEGKAVKINPDLERAICETIEERG